ncbi:DUF6221 family protein [Streptomyces sp. NPDC030592]|uniref:DUF6221 family protein n=1 Tax=Streptomyces sp. NPDC030592 TaxID=3155365 RepID=UPI0033EC8AF1
MPDNLVQFLHHRLDEDQAAAERASSRSASWSPNGTLHLDGVEHDVVGDEEAFCHPHNVAHIARQDPQRALAQVAANRAIVKGFADLHANPARHTDAALHLSHHVMLRVVLQLASVHASHPDYDEEWCP